MKSDLKCKIDGVAIGEINAELLTPPGSLNCKYAYLNSATEARMGSGHFNQWSEPTIAKFAELLELMERDIIAAMFEPDGGNPYPSAPTMDSAPHPYDVPDTVPGL